MQILAVDVAELFHLVLLDSVYFFRQPLSTHSSWSKGWSHKGYISAAIVLRIIHNLLYIEFLLHRLQLHPPPAICDPGLSHACSPSCFSAWQKPDNSFLWTANFPHSPFFVFIEASWELTKMTPSSSEVWLWDAASDPSRNAKWEKLNKNKQTSP